MKPSEGKALQQGRAIIAKTVQLATMATSCWHGPHIQVTHIEKTKVEAREMDSKKTSMRQQQE